MKLSLQFEGKKEAKKMEQEVKLQVRLPLDTRDWLRVFAAQHNRSMNGQIVAMLKEAMAREKEETMT